VREQGEVGEGEGQRDAACLWGMLVGWMVVVVVVVVKG
jgi:hypothetical protein